LFSGRTRIGPRKAQFPILICVGNDRENRFAARSVRCITVCDENHVGVLVRKGPRPRRSTAHDARTVSISPISEARGSVRHAVIIVAGRTWQVTVPLVAVRVGHPVVTFDARSGNPRRLPSRACRRSADRSKHECRSQCRADLASHINLLIVGRSAECPVTI
jgi:hypothetical protein